MRVSAGRLISPRQECMTEICVIGLREACPMAPCQVDIIRLLREKKSIYTVIQMEIVCNDVFLNLRSSLLNDYLIEGNEQEITAEHK